MGNKRGIVEIQLNWIYVAIVGAMIIAMFVSIASGIKRNASSSFNFDALNYFDEVFTTIAGSENTEHSILLSGINIEVDSAKTGYDQCNFYRVEGTSQQGQGIENLPVFSPALLKGLVLGYSAGWDIPFRAAYFLFLSSPETIYVFTDTESYTLRDIMPKHLSKYSIKLSGFENENYDGIRFIAYNKDSLQSSLSSSVSGMKGNAVSAVLIEPAKKTATFYRKSGTSLEETTAVPVIDQETMMAAVYSDSAESYICNLNKAISRAGIVAQLLKKRITLVKVKPIPPGCILSKYDDAAALLSKMEDAAKGGLATLDTLRIMSTAKQNLEKLNSELILKSCPSIY